MGQCSLLSFSIILSVSVKRSTSVWLDSTPYRCLPPLSALIAPSCPHPVLFQTPDYCRDLPTNLLTAPALRFPSPPPTPVQRGWWDAALVPLPPARLPRIHRWRLSSPRCPCSLPRSLRLSSFSSGPSCPSTEGETHCASFGLIWQHQGSWLAGRTLLNGRENSLQDGWIDKMTGNGWMEIYSVC